MPPEFKPMRYQNLMSRLPEDREGLVEFGTTCLVKAWFIAADASGSDDAMVVEGHLRDGRTYEITVDVK